MGPVGGQDRTAALDGLRAVAVLGVLLFHAVLLPGGFLGVSSFFTLSGFLIARLVIVELETTGRLDLGPFWSRRARRLLPASVACCFLVLLYGAMAGTPTQLHALRGDMLAAFGQVANWRFLAAGKAYANRFSDPSPLQHYWSLAIEEQFYLVLPLVLAAVAWRTPAHRIRRAVLAAAASLAAVGAGIGWFVSPTHAYYGTETRLPELAVGVALAAWLGTAHGVRVGHRAVAVARRLVVPALVALGALWWFAEPSARWISRGGLLANALATAVVIVALHERTAVTAILSRRPLVWLGRVSYGVYLYHWPVFLWLTPERVGVRAWPLLGVRLAVTVGLAQLSWRLVEQPVRHRRVLHGRAARYALGAAVVLVVCNLALVTARPPQPALAFTDVRGEAPIAATTTVAAPPAAVTTSTFVTPVVTTPPTPLKVMIVGDSIGLTLARGFLDVATGPPSLRVFVDAEVGCSLATGGRRRALGYDDDDPAKCATRNEALTGNVVSFQPDVVVVLSCLWDVADRVLPGERRWRTPGDPRYDAFTTASLAATADAIGATGATIAWLSCPLLDPDYHPDRYMGPPPYPVADPARVAHLNELVAATLADRPNARLLDLAGFLAARPGGELDRSRRPDGVHLAVDEARLVAAWALRQVGVVVPDTVGGLPD